jgi:hypothetical protein
MKTAVLASIPAPLDDPGRSCAPEHFSVRFTAKKCGTTKKRVDSTKVEAALSIFR